MIKKRFLCGVLTGIMVLSSFVVGGQCVQELYAAENVVSPCYVTLASASAGLSISGSTATAKTTVETKKESTIKIKMHLKKKVGTSWEIVQTWNSSVTNSMDSILKKSCAISSGTYRVYSIITVDGEEVVRTSSIVTK